MDCGVKCIQYLIFIFNFLFWVSGIAIIAVGAVIQVQVSKYSDVMSDGFTAGAVLLIVVGCIVTVVAFLGCCGAMKENYCMIMTFAVLLGIIFVLELAAGITCYVYRNEVNSLAESEFMDMWKSYDASSEQSKAIDAIQHDLKCCGVENATDWVTAGWPWSKQHPGQLPSSCCKEQSGACSLTTGDPYTRGCYQQLILAIKDAMIIVAGVGIGVAFIQLLGIVFACCLASAIKKSY